MELYTMSAWQVMVASGPMVWPILACSIFAVAIVTEKLLYLSRIELDTGEFLNSILEKMKRHQIKEAIQVCDSAKAPLSQILKAGILKYDRSRPQIKEAIEDASLYEIPRLEKNLPALATIAYVAPLLGLLGTVIGMVKCFRIIQLNGLIARPVAAADLSGGIWQALLDTVAGLAVAIPAYVAYNYLVSRVNNYILELEKASTELVNFLTE